MNLQEKVQQLTNENYEFKFGEYFSKGWDYFSARMGLFIGFFVVNMLIIIACSLIPVIGGIASSFVATILLVGYYIVCHGIKYGKEVSFDHFFKGFKSAGSIVIIQLILFGFTIVIIAPMMIYFFSSFFTTIIEAASDPYYREPQTPGEFFELFDIATFIPLVIITYIFLIFIQTIYMFAAVIAHFYKSSAWPSMEASRKIIQKKFFYFFGLIFVIGLINVVGALCLFIGLLFTAPLSYCIMYAAFDDIFSPSEDQGLIEVNQFEDRQH